MAIVIEERHGSESSSIVSLLLWLVVLGVIGSAIYYVFFAESELVNYVPPSGFAETVEASHLQIDPAAVTQDVRFTSLQQWITVSVDGSFGKVNPFLAPGAPVPAKP